MTDQKSWNEILGEFFQWMKAYAKERLKHHTKYEVIDMLFQASEKAIKSGKLGARVKRLMNEYPKTGHFILITVVNAVLITAGSDIKRFTHK